MEHKRLNLAFAVYQGRELPVVKDGDIIRESNLAQMERDTPLFDGVKDLTFEDCNLVNVRLDPAWNVKGCNTFQGDYSPAEIFPSEATIREQAQREAVKQQLMEEYIKEVDAATADIATADLSVDVVKESIEAMRRAEQIAPIKEIP